MSQKNKKQSKQDKPKNMKKTHDQCIIGTEA